MELCKVALAGIGDSEDNAPGLVQRPRDLQRGERYRSGRAAAEYSFFPRELSGGLERIPVRHIYDLVDVFHVDVFGNNLLSNPLDQVWSGLEQLAALLERLEYRSVWIGSDYSNGGIYPPQVPAPSPHLSPPPPSPRPNPD